MEKKKKKAPKQLLQASSVNILNIDWATRLESQIRAQRQGEFMGNSNITHINFQFFQDATI
jgi:hypothetical protein